MARKQSPAPTSTRRAGRGTKTLVTPWTRWLKAVRASEGLKQDEFAQHIGTGRSALAMYETGAPIPAAVVASIRHAFPSAAAPPSSGDVQILSNMGDEARTYMIPYAGVVPASENWGDPLSQEEAKEVSPKLAGRGRYMCRVIGNSCWPALWQGDLTIWQKESAPNDGMIVLAERLSDRACTVKELVLHAGMPILKPINPEFPNMGDPDGWEVTAVLVGVLDYSTGVEIEYYAKTGLRAEALSELRRP